MADRFRVEFASRARKDLSKLPKEARDIILRKTKILEQAPYPRGKIKKRIKGVKYPLFRLRVNTPSNSFRIFYGMQDQVVLILRIVSKKEADRVLRTFRG